MSSTRGTTPPGWQCICKICTCGKHRCPMHPEARSYDPELLRSMYRNDYLKHPIACKAEKVQDQWKPSQTRFEGESTHQHDFQPWAVERQGPSRRDGGQLPANRPFEGKSTYGSDFTKKAVQPHQLKKGGEYKPSNAPFYGDTTHNSDFKWWETGPRATVERKAQLLPKVPFQGNTTYQNDFTGKRVPPAKPVRHEQPYRSGAPGYYDTTYGNDFDAKPLDTCPVPGLPPKPASPNAHIYYRKTGPRSYIP